MFPVSPFIPYSTVVVALALLVIAKTSGYLHPCRLEIPKTLCAVQGWLEVDGWSGAQLAVQSEAPMLHGLQLGFAPGEGRLLLAPL